MLLFIILCSMNAAYPYLIMNSADYDYLDKDEAAHIANSRQFCVNTSDVDEIRELAKSYRGVYVYTREERVFISMICLLLML